MVAKYLGAQVKPKKLESQFMDTARALDMALHGRRRRQQKSSHVAKYKSCLADIFSTPRFPLHP